MASSVATLADMTEAQVRAPAAAIPWYCYAVALGATSILFGSIWDISWHQAIGRDSFWTPAHVAIYLGGVIPGFTCGWLVLQASFFGTLDERAAAVRVWGLYGPLGAWICIWGAIAMITSAPFDDWWHNAYGLDVKIISPPHVLLALGGTGIRVGTLILVLAAQNRAAKEQQYGLALLFVFIASGMLVGNAVVTMEHNFPHQQHSNLFYQVSALVYPMALVATARASKLRWGASMSAAFYMGFVCLMVWTLPLFPAEPKLAPILNPVDHMVAPPFPLWLVVPALGIDILMQRLGRKRDWTLTLCLGAAFVSLFFVVQWFFSAFMLSSYSHNWFFAGDRIWAYFVRPGEWQTFFWGQKTDAVSLSGMGSALLISLISVRIGLWWGSWMERVQR